MCVIKKPTRGDRVIAVLSDIVLGIAHGFPLCCIEEYIKDSLLGRAPAAYRRSRYGHLWPNNELGYVPCSHCLKSRRVKEVPRVPIDDAPKYEIIGSAIARVLWSLDFCFWGGRERHLKQKKEKRV